MTKNKHINVLMVVANYPYPIVGGLEKQAHELSKLLINKNIKITILSGKFAPSQNRYELIDNVPVHRLTWPESRIIRYSILPFRLLYFFLKNKNDFDIVHLHTLSWLSIYALLVAKVLNKYTVLKLANVGEFGLTGLSNSFLGALKLRIVKMSDTLVSMSHISKQEAIDIGYPVGRVFMTPNGISLNSDLTKIYSHKSDICTVVFVGRLDYQKNLESFLYVWNKIKLNIAQDTVLEIWGDGKLRKKLEALSETLNLYDSIIFRGSVTSVQSKLKKVDIFVLPSLAEGNSNAILEAMAVGLPVISTNVGGTLMQVGCEGAKYISEPNDDLELYLNLKNMIEDGELRIRIGKAMYSRVDKYFKMDTIADGYISMYSYLVSGKKNQIVKLTNKVFADNG